MQNYRFVKNLVILGFLITITCGVFSQTISGVVLDEQGEPAIGAAVFFDGTSIGTTTNIQGIFSINVKQTISSALIVSHIGYQTVVVNDPIPDKSYTIHLVLKPVAIKEVIVKPDPFTREQKLKAFKQEFIGRGRAGALCRIINEDDIQLNYDVDLRTLYASSSKPISVENFYLGYNVDFYLIDFFVKYNKISLKSEFIHSTMFLIASYFSEVDKTSTKQIKNRTQSYKGSQLNFFRELSLMNFGKKGFMIFDKSLPIDPNSAFQITDTIGMKRVAILQNPSYKRIIDSNQNKIGSNIRAFNILYNGKKQSLIMFKIDTIFIDYFGCNSHPDQIFFGGDMSKRRFAKLLPFDYQIAQ